jgi:hypothetical protein
LVLVPLALLLVLLLGLEADFLAGRMMISRASWVPLTTGPPANTCSPADRALAVVFLPSWRTTESATRTQVHVVPSLALMTTSLPETDWTVPRSNASVFGPALVSKVNWPSMPSRRSRRSGWRNRCRAAVPAVVAGAAAEESAEFSTAAWPDGLALAEAGLPLPKTVTAPKAAPAARTLAAAVPAISRVRRVWLAWLAGAVLAGRVGRSSEYMLLSSIDPRVHGGPEKAAS